MATFTVMFAERLIFRFSSSLLYYHFQSTGDVRERQRELHTAAPLANVSLSLSLFHTHVPAAI